MSDNGAPLYRCLRMPLILALRQALSPSTRPYVAVQQHEGNIIQTLIQRKVVSLPPALTLFGMVAGGLLFGFLGLVLAAPAVVVAYVLIKRLYVVELLHTPTFVPGEKSDEVDR